MHVLITSDTVGGVWTYTQELVTGLAQRGHKVTLVSFGKLPTLHQTAWMRMLPGVDYRPTEYRLEWMETAEPDIDESRRYLEMLVREVNPDVLHFSQYCYGDIDADVPRIVVAHSDVVSWWVAVHSKEPDDTPWMRRYREHVKSGLRRADLVVAPSAWMLEALARHYGRPQHGMVIYNGRNPELFDPNQGKEEFALSVGRIWDEGKYISLLLKTEGSGTIRIVGWEQEPGREKKALPTLSDNVQLLGPKSQAELRELYASAAIYVATSRYEPFGLSPLEAALSGCALVINDIPVFHELWGDAALYFQRNDPHALAELMSELKHSPWLREQYGARAYETACRKFTAARTVADYENAYQQVAAPIARVA
jgi:glycosyltransferase involved in cell wall biosynthesis